MIWWDREMKFGKGVYLVAVVMPIAISMKIYPNVTKL